MSALRPMMEMLTKASCRLSLHMPGGQGKSPFGSIDPYLLDTTETGMTDDLYAPSNGIEKAQQLGALLDEFVDALVSVPEE